MSVIEINNNLDPDNDVSDKDLKITADITSTTSWESNLQLEVELGDPGGIDYVSDRLEFRINGVCSCFVEASGSGPARCGHKVDIVLERLLHR